MSFDLLRRQHARLAEVAASGTYDSVVEAVEAAAAARAYTDEGGVFHEKEQKRQRGPASGGGGKHARDSAAQQREVDMQHRGSISLNESVARTVAEARMASDTKRNLLDHQRRFLHSRMSKDHLQHIGAARDTAAALMSRKTDSTAGRGGGGAKKKAKKA